AYQRLADLERRTPGAHFLSRHGATTTSHDQRTRATTGMTPDGVPGAPRDASRFLSHADQLDAIGRAVAAHRPGQPCLTFDMGRVIGEGYRAASPELRSTTWATVAFVDDRPCSAYPNLRRS
ncbi:MAG: hypothetical protein ACRD0M_10805, partial [Acidimicrobiales bacterium]